MKKKVRRLDLAIVIQIKAQLTSATKPHKNMSDVVESVTVRSNLLTANFY